MTRSRARDVLVSFLFVCALPWAAPLHAQSDAESVAMLLEHSEARSVLATFHDGVAGALSQTSAEPLAPEVSAIVDLHLDVDALLPIMTEQLMARGDTDVLGAAARLVSGGALARIDSIQQASPPASTLEEFALSLQASPPPQARVLLVAQFAQTQAAGDFYVYVFEAVREAAHAIAQEASISGTTFEPLSDEAWDEQAQQGFMFAVVEFLHRFQAVDDDLLREGIEEWSTDEGAWFIEAYTLALGETLQIATADIVAELRAL